MAEVSRAQYLLNMIDMMDQAALSNAPQFSLNHAYPGYRYMDRGQGNIEPQYPDGKRPAGLMSKAGKSA
jgi:hypothetical protein